MNFAELIRKRYSVRAYKPNAVPDDLLAQVLEAGRLAPTAANKQPFRIIVIHTRGREAELRRIYHRDWFTQAPGLNTPLETFARTGLTAAGFGEFVGKAYQYNPPAVGTADFNSQPNFTASGGPIQFDEHGDNVGASSAMVQIREGRARVIVPKEFAELQPVYPIPKLWERG